VRNKIYNEDCILTMKRMDDKSINGIITSPPYNINTQRKDNYYENGYRHLEGLTEDQYLQVRLEEFKEFSRILKDDGVICYNISYGNNNPILPTLLVTLIHNETDLTLADIICWKKNTSIPFQTSPTKLSRLSELIYVFVRKDRLHDFKTNKEVTKINQKTGQKFYKYYVNYIEAKNNDGYISQLKAAYSQELVDKLIDIYFPPDSLIYDPFTGIGTTQLSCIRNGCDYLGSELVLKHYEIANQRISEYITKKDI
jgi:DNA modification methylase